MLLRSIALGACAFLLSGCVERPSTFARMSDELRIWQQAEYESVGADERSPISLEDGFAEAVLGAVVSNPEYVASLAFENEAMQQIGVAQSLLRPQFVGNGSVGAIREYGGGQDKTTTGIMGGINISQLVYDGGEAVSSVNKATAAALVAQSDRVVQGNEVALNSARAWVDFSQYAERLRLMRSRASEMNTLVDQIERMASNGMLDKASLESARRQIVEIKLEESRLQAGLIEAQVLFHRYFGATPVAVPRASEIVSAVQARALAQDWQLAPTLRRNAAELLVAKAALGEAKSAFRPRARLQAGARSPMESGESTDLTVGLTFEYSFSDGGRRKKQLEAAKARVAAMDAQLRSAKLGMEAELQAGLARLASIDLSMPLLEEKLRLSRSEADTSRSQLLTGQSNLRQLVEAEIEIYRAQDQQIAVKAERQILLLTIAARTGALSQLIGIEK